MKLFSRPKKTEQRRYFKADDVEGLLILVERNDKGGRADHFRLWQFIYKVIPNLPHDAKMGVRLVAPYPYVWWEE